MRQPWDGAGGKSIDNRLFRYDRRIVINALRSAFARWHDRLIVLAAVLVALLAARASLATTPGAVATYLAFAAGLVIGLRTARLIGGRLAFHASDGVLAADALGAKSRRLYASMWHSLALAGVAVIILMVRPALLAFGLAGYLAGASLGHLVHGAWPGRFLGGVAPGRAIRAYLRRPSAGIVLALVVLPLLLAVRSSGQGVQAATAGLLAAGAVPCLTTVDDALVGFLTSCGYGSWTIVQRHARGCLVFLSIVLPVCLIGRAFTIAGMVAATTAIGLALMAMRVLAYRLHERRPADLIVAMLVAVTAMVGAASPILLPFVVAVILWQLHRRAATRSWLLP